MPFLQLTGTLETWLDFQEAGSVLWETLPSSKFFLVEVRLCEAFDRRCKHLNK